MVMKNALGFTLLFLLHLPAYSQTDSTSVVAPSKYTHADSVFLAKLNSNGNIMIAAGVGLTGVGGYLIYQGNKIYNSKAAPGSSTPAQDESRNKRQGTIYLAAGGAAIAGGIVLAAFGIRNKVEFKHRKKMMSIQGGLLDNGQLGALLTF